MWLILIVILLYYYCDIQYHTSSLDVCGDNCWFFTSPISRKKKRDIIGSHLSRRGAASAKNDRCDNVCTYYVGNVVGRTGADTIVQQYYM